ncbi:MAG: hypothetical protein ABSB54_07770 [Acidimicrobiales bacterium]|jgi:hypothetical protein
MTDEGVPTPANEPAQQPAQLSSHHRDTLEQIFRHPSGHNIEWHDVLSLLEAVASVREGHDGKYVVTLGGETEMIERPKHKDIAVQQVVDLRRMLRAAGYHEQLEEAKADDD